jgi:peptidoglycan hydrolase-like protein with peptidoglycan-binding domain
MTNQGEKMLLTAKTVRSAFVFAFCAALTIGMLSSSANAASNSDDVKKAQQSLSDKGFYHGPIDGIAGPRTRQAIADYQKSEHRTVTRRLDVDTAGRLGVGRESVGGDFKGTGREVAAGSKEAGHDVKKGEPVTAGKEFGKGIGRGAKDVGKGVKEAVAP